MSEPVRLPPVAVQRLDRARASGVRSSLLGVAGAAGVELAGFDAVGEVLGACAQRVGWSGFGGCGYGVPYLSTPTVVSGAGARWAGFAPLVAALYAGFDTALARLLAEAAALGADGVVGVALREQGGGGDVREFTALGTAVRSRGRVRAQRPFATELSGPEVGALLQAGWVPSGIVRGLSLGVRHDDYQTRRQATSWQGTEVEGYTDLLTQTRSDARRQLHARAARLGADGTLLGGVELEVWSREPSDNHRDHLARCTVTGTALARFAAPQPRSAPTLTVLPLRGATR